MSILLLGLFLGGFVLQNVIAGDDERPSAVGHYQILISDEPLMTIDFDVRAQRDGTTVGEMAFQRSPKAADSTSTGEAALIETKTAFLFKANFDCLVIDGNKAVMSGKVTQSSAERYLDKRVLLVVQDNGHGSKPGSRDKLTWGLYKAPVDNTLASDFERPNEQDAGAWVASDLERPDDTGLISQKNQQIGCNSFPLSSFSFFNAIQGHGDIHVRPGSAIRLN
ncbi:MAG: hypothetical protein ABJC10_05865 [Acidobacteriota bacterium]